MRLIDLTGKKFGRLTVIKKAVKRGKRTYWLCSCDCGKETEVYAYSLTKGATRSCGCLLAESTRDRVKKYNTYDFINQEYVIGYDSKGNCFYFDIEDYEQIKSYYWSKDSLGYFAADHPYRVRLHRLVMNANKEHHVDHINHDKTDNRKMNLRLCSIEENNWNGKLRKDNKSGLKCVKHNEKSDTWSARITYKGNRMFLGRFDTKQKAYDAYCDAAKSYFGEFAHFGDTSSSEEMYAD